MLSDSTGAETEPGGGADALCFCLCLNLKGSHRLLRPTGVVTPTSLCAALLCDPDASCASSFNEALDDSAEDTADDAAEDPREPERRELNDPSETRRLPVSPLLPQDAGRNARIRLDWDDDGG